MHFEKMFKENCELSVRQEPQGWRLCVSAMKKNTHLFMSSISKLLDAALAQLVSERELRTQG